MSRIGTIYTHSVVRSGAAGFHERTPYLLALVQEGEELRMARVEGYRDGARIDVGDEVAYVAEDGKGNPVYRLLK